MGGAGHPAYFTGQAAVQHAPPAQHGIPQQEADFFALTSFFASFASQQGMAQHAAAQQTLFAFGATAFLTVGVARAEETRARPKARPVRSL